MQATRSTILAAICDDLDAAEAALLHIEASEGSPEAQQRLSAVGDAAAALNLARTERIARAAERLIARGAKARHLAVRAILRLRDLLRTLNEGQAEPPGDDTDLAAAAEAEDLPSLADTLSQARARLLQISTDNRDPRLDALLERLANLGSELAEDARSLPEIDEIEETEALRRSR